MLRSFFLHSAIERICIGDPAPKAIADELERCGERRALLICSATLANQTDTIERIRMAIGDAYVGHFAQVPSHGARGAVLAAAAMARSAGADVLIAVGGGSVMDTAKVVSLCLANGATQHDDLERLRVGAVVPAGWSLKAPDVRIIAVPTTLSGAEVGNAAGVTDERTGGKQTYAHALMVPRALLLDPLLTKHTPERTWLSTGVRAMDHAIEALGSFQSDPLCDDLADSVLRTLVEALPRTRSNPEDLDARLQCLIAAWQVTVPQNLGVPMGISHACSYVLGSGCGVPHGQTSCITAPAALVFNSSANLERQQRISASLGDAGAPAGELLDRFIAGLGLPRTLGDVGLGPQDLPRLAQGLLRDRWAATNPRPIESNEDALAFLQTLL